MMYLKNLLLTDTFVIKGHLNTGSSRLSTFLNNFPRRFLEVEEATVIDHVQGIQFTTSRMRVRVEEIIVAFEMEEAGDEALRHLSGQERDDTAVTIRYNGPVLFQISGRVNRHAIERDNPGQYDFLVVVDPTIIGLRSKTLEVFRNLPYLIANKSRIALVVE